MNIYQNLEDSLYAMVIALFPTWRIIFPFQNGPEPETPYLVIDVQRLDALGREQTSGAVTVTNGVGTTTMVQNYQAFVRFEFVGKNDTNTTVAEMSQQLDLNLRTPQGYELQHVNNISLYNYAPVERLVAKRETDVYMFYQLDTTFGYAVKVVPEQNWIEATSVTGVYRDAGREPDYTITSTIEIPN